MYSAKQRQKLIEAATAHEAEIKFKHPLRSNAADRFLYKVRCRNGHVVTSEDWSTYPECAICAKKPNKLSRFYWNRKYKENNLGIQVIKKVGKTYTFKCDKEGHLTYRKSIATQSTCTKCRVSLPHKKVSLWLTKHNIPHEVNVRGLIPRAEIDIVIPSRKLAIEIDGVYWHTETGERRLWRRKALADAGYRLVRFWDIEITNKSKAVSSMLASILHLSKYRVGARQCVVESIDSTTANNFLNTYHIQGAVNASVRLGLYHNKKLLAVMTFGKPRLKAKAKAEWELLRFCVKAGYNLPGAASKLYTHFSRLYNPTSILSFADRRYSEGGLYLALGFSLARVSTPGYFYWSGRGILSRYKAQKHKLPLLLGPAFDSSKSETFNMEAAGWHKRFDDGQLVFTKGVLLPTKVNPYPEIDAPPPFKKREKTTTIAGYQKLIHPSLVVQGDPDTLIDTRTKLVHVCTKCKQTTTSYMRYNAIKAFKEEQRSTCSCRGYGLDDFLKELPKRFKYVSGFKGRDSTCLFIYKPTGHEVYKKAWQALANWRPRSTGSAQLKPLSYYLTNLKNSRSDIVYVKGFTSGARCKCTFKHLATGKTFVMTLQRAVEGCLPHPRDLGLLAPTIPLGVIKKRLKSANPDFVYVSGYTSVMTPANFTHTPTGLLVSAVVQTLLQGRVPNEVRRALGSVGYIYKRQHSG